MIDSLRHEALPNRAGWKGQVTLKVDVTGVGRAVLDILEQAHGDGILPCGTSDQAR